MTALQTTGNAQSSVRGGSQSVAIRLLDVEKRFEEFHAVRGVNIEIQNGELLVLLGPSGCGKTTTLNMLAGLEVPTAGEIRFGEKIVNDLPPEERDIAMVFQSIALYPHLNVRDNVGFALKTKRLDKKIVAERTAEVAEILGLTSMLDRKITQLSGGQRQRVAIAKALVRRPALFLLDEPFSSLDAELRRQMRSELIRIHREVETTMVFVTHDQEEAMAIADRIGVMNEGKLIQLGDPIDLYLRPVNSWVARFIGAHPINFMPAEVSEDGSSIHLRQTDAQTVAMSADIRQLLGERLSGNTITIGVRPEYLRLGAETGAGLARGEVYTRQVLGTEVLYEVQAGEHLLRAVGPITNILPEGTPVEISIDWEHLFIFDPATEERIFPA